MPREKTGSIVKRDRKVYARLQFLDDSGKKRDLWRKVSNRKEAKDKLTELIEESETKSSKELDASRMTLNHLADFYEENYLHEAIYVNERKISGLRNVGCYKFLLKNLRTHFGKQLIQNITYFDIAKFRLKYFKTPTIYGNQRSISNVNRQMQMLRRLLNIAVREEWINKNPFKNGDSLISLADENQRSRILSFTEERQLFYVIDKEPKRFHLKGIVFIALDCALRKNEIVTICRKDIDFDNRTINIRAFNTKTAKSRKVGMTNRVYKWLSQFKNFNGEERIFPFKDFDGSWRKSIKQAGIKDFHFHDCRHTSISRMIKAGLPHTEVMRVSGHTTLSCLYKYINTDAETVFRVATVLDDYWFRQNTQEICSDLIN